MTFGLRNLLQDLGLLLLRAGAGSMMLFGHGWGKFATFSEKAAHFPDPLGVGSAASLGMAVSAEVFCSAALILGLLTRFVSILLLITMSVAGLIVHSADPWAKKELAFAYGLVFLTLMLVGGGKFSLDHWLLRRRK